MAVSSTVDPGYPNVDDLSQITVDMIILVMHTILQVRK